MPTSSPTARELVKRLGAKFPEASRVWILSESPRERARVGVCRPPSSTESTWKGIPAPRADRGITSERSVRGSRIGKVPASWKTGVLRPLLRMIFSKTDRYHFI